MSYYIRLADNKLYLNDDPNIPDYGDWYCTISNDGTLVLRGDSDTSLLPTNIPLGSTAITNAGESYFFNTNGWEII